MSHKCAPSTAVSTIGIDLGKNSFHLVGLDERGAIVLQLKCSRAQLERRLANIPSCLIGMEACSGARYIGRQLAALGRDVRLIPAQYVKPFLKGHKNDHRDAEAIAEAVQTDHALRGDQDAGADGPAGSPSRALAPGEPAHGCDQSNPRVPDRARHHRAARCGVVAQGAA
jgi:Transposase